MNASAGVIDAPSAAKLDQAVVLCCELSGRLPQARGFTDTAAEAATAFGIDAAVLWSHIDAGIEMWPELATFPSAPPELLERWLASPDQNVASRAWANPAIDPARLDDTARCWVDDWSVGHMRRYAALNNTGLSPETLRLFAARREHELSRWVAQNPSTPPDVLADLATFATKLSRDDERILVTVLENPSTPAEVLAKFSRSAGPSVRIAVASNPSTPLEAVQHLATADTRHYMVPYYANRELERRAALV